MTHETSMAQEDIKMDELDKLISTHPILEVLKFQPEFDISVEYEGSMIDNRFDAPYQEHTVTGGGFDPEIEGDIQVFWTATEGDLKWLKESDEKVPERLLKLFTNLINSEPASGVEFDITSIVNKRKMDDIVEACEEEISHSDAGREEDYDDRDRDDEF